MTITDATNHLAASDLIARYVETRRTTEELAAPLSIEDQVVQSMPDASPTKWHLGHTTWFFETFVLGAGPGNAATFDDQFSYLFNSYYETVGRRQPRAERGLLTRPGNSQVVAYRSHVDEALVALLDANPTEQQLELVELGINHEQQHQELLLMDALHLLSLHPFSPAYTTAPTERSPERSLGWLRHDGGVHRVGHEGASFAYDNEGPRHDALVHPFEIADRPVTCGEYLEFIEDGGYDDPLLWLSDGWYEGRKQGWRAPQYWHLAEKAVFDLHGEHPLDPGQPVSHLSYYEAEAFARWAGARLPTEFEWEVAFGSDDPADGRFRSGDVFHAVGPGANQTAAMGTLWEWTASAYLPYPGFETAEGAVGEYNGKFMVNTHVLRGGCHLTPPGHLRATYRNFFAPHTRWHASGIRLARNVA